MLSYEEDETVSDVDNLMKMSDFITTQIEKKKFKARCFRQLL